jgi:hypothetical protein
VGEAVERILAEAPLAGETPKEYTQLELAQRAYGVEKPTAAQLSAVRRVTARLVAAGKAERVGRAEARWDRASVDDDATWHVRGRRGRSRRAPHWARNPGFMCVRRTPTPEQKAAEEQRWKKSLAELRERFADQP